MRRRSTIIGYEHLNNITSKAYDNDIDNNNYPSLPLKSKSISSTSQSNYSTTASTTRQSSLQTTLTNLSTTSTLTPLDKLVIKNYHILLELIKTEVNYFNDLNILVNVYLPNLPKTLSYPTRNLIKRNISSIFALHSRINNQLDDCLKHDKDHLDNFHIGPGSSQYKSFIDNCTEKVANVFINQAPYFDIYSSFCANHSNALSKLSISYNSPIWIQYERKCFIQSQQIIPHNNKLQLKDYLIKPIQRVCRYPLVLDQLAKSSNSKHGEINTALDKMRQVAQQADIAKLERNKQEKTDLVVQRCQNHSTLSHNEIQSFGHVKLIGALDVFVHNSKLPLVPPLKVKYLGAFLYERFILLVKVRKSTIYEPRYWFPLDLWHVTDVPSGEGLMQHSFRLSLHFQHFEFSCCSDNEKNIWMKSIIDSISISRKLWSLDYVAAMSSEDIKPLPCNVPYSLAHRKPTAAATAEDVEDHSKNFKHLSNKRNSLPVSTETLMNNLNNNYDEDDQQQDASTSNNNNNEINQTSTPVMSLTPHYNLLPPPDSAPSISTSSSTKFVYHNGNPAEPLILRRSPSAPRAAVDKCLYNITSEEIQQARKLAAMELAYHNHLINFNKDLNNNSNSNNINHGTSNGGNRPRKIHSIHQDLNIVGGSANSNNNNINVKKEIKRRRSFVYLNTTNSYSNSFGDIFDDNNNKSHEFSNAKSKMSHKIQDIYGVRKRKNSTPLPSTSNTKEKESNGESTSTDLFDEFDHNLKNQVYKNRRKLGHSFSSRFSSFGDSFKSLTPGNVSPLATPTAIYAGEKDAINDELDESLTQRKRNKSFSGLRHNLKSHSEQNLWQAAKEAAKKPLSETEEMYIKYLQGDIGPPNENDDKKQEQSESHTRPAAPSRNLSDDNRYSRGRTNNRNNDNVVDTQKRSKSKSRLTNILTRRTIINDHFHNNEQPPLPSPKPVLELPSEFGRMSPLSKSFDYPEIYLNERKNPNQHNKTENEINKKDKDNVGETQDKPRNSNEARQNGAPQLPKLIVTDGGIAFENNQSPTTQDFNPQPSSSSRVNNNENNDTKSKKSFKYKSWSSSTPNLLSRFNSFSRSKRKSSAILSNTEPPTPTGDNHNVPSLSRKKSLGKLFTKMNFTKT